MKKINLTILFILATITICVAGDELFVYEPFDYKTYNDEIIGRLEGRNGGIGFAEAWIDSGDHRDFAFIFDKRGNPEKLYDGRWGKGKPDWDGKVDNLPTLGGYMANSDWNNAYSGLHSTRKLAKSAGEMAKKNGGVLWLSAVWHLPAQHFFAPVGIALASNDGGFKERAVEIEKKGDAIGVGNGNNFRKRSKPFSPIIWKNGKEVAGSPGARVNGKKDNIIILKFEFGKTDKVSAWYFTEDQKLTEADFNKNAFSCSSEIDEDSLQYLSVATILKDNAIDEIRIGPTFKTVISGTMPPRQEVKITKTEYNTEDDTYTLHISSNPGEIYGIYLPENSLGYKPCISSVLKAATDKKITTFGPFASPRKGNPNLQFEIGLPDTTPPEIERVWGNGNEISLIFSEKMLPDMALSSDNYQVKQKDGTILKVKAVKFDPENASINLTLEKPLKAAEEFSVTTSNLTDLGNHPLKEKKVSFQTWDNDPEGIKVFILAGQSNMVGYGHSEIGDGGKVGGQGTLRYLAVNNKKYPEYDYTSLLVDPAKPATSPWKNRKNVKVWWKNGVRGKLGGPVGKGELGPPFRGGNEKWFGPEYGFGQVIGDLYPNDDVLIIKAAWGGHNLVTQFRSPDAVAKRGGEIGASYEEVFNDSHQVLQNLGKEFPEWKGKGYEIVGFAWHQGTSDKGPELVADEYKQNLPDLIKSVRSEFGKPNLPFVIATTGMSNAGPVESHPYKGYHPVEKAQLWVAGVEKPSNVLTDDTRKYWETKEVSPRSQGYHWHHNARSYFRVGLGLGNNMVKLLDK